MTVDAANTCHIVGCPRKGEHPPHTFIGTPDTFAPYAVASNGEPGRTLIATSLLVRADSLLQAFIRGRLVATTTVDPSILEEARILSEAFRTATSSGAKR